MHPVSLAPKHFFGFLWQTPEPLRILDEFYSKIRIVEPNRMIRSALIRISVIALLQEFVALILFVVPNHAQDSKGAANTQADGDKAASSKADDGAKSSEGGKADETNQV